MLYSHIRFMIADVEMPVSGPIYVSGGMLQTRLSFILSGDDKSLYYASPLARVKYERVPVKLLGSKPQASVADDENGGIDNYIVIFEGAADMQISFSQSTRQLDIAVQAVPLSVKALDSIIYSMLSIGSVTSNVNQAARTAYEKKISEGNAEKVVVTAGGGSPHSANSILFLKKLVTGGSPADILRPTDMIEYAINNILGYADSAILKDRKEVPFLPSQKAFRDLDGGNGVDSLPKYVLDKLIGEPESVGESGERVWKPGSPGIRYGVLANEFLCRKVMVELTMIKASRASGRSYKEQAEATDLNTAFKVNESVLNYLKDDGLWAPDKRIKPSASAKLGEMIETNLKGMKDVTASKCLPGVIMSGLALRDEKKEEIPDLTKAMLYGEPEFFGMINGMVKCFLSALRFFVIRSNRNTDSWTLFDLLYTSVNTSGQVTDIIGRVKDLVGSGFAGRSGYRDIYGNLLTAFQDTLSDLVKYQEGTTYLGNPTAVYTAIPDNRMWNRFAESGAAGSEGQVWFAAVRTLTDAAVSEVLDLVSNLTSYLSDTNSEYVLAPSYIPEFRSAKHNTANEKLGFDLDRIASLMVTLYDGYDKKGLLSEEELKYPEPTRFDVQAVRSVANSTLYNRVAAPEFLRLAPGKEPKRKCVYPHMAVAAYEDFKQLVSATALSDTSARASLRELLTMLYNRFNLSLATPLNKPVCGQSDKQIDSRKGIDVDPEHSLAEILVLPNHELQVVPKCNVFAVDMRYGAQLQYSEQSNLARLLVRYTPPVDVVGGSSTDVPVQVFEFDLTDPEKDMQPVSPSTLEERNNARRVTVSQNGYVSGHTLGSLYNLESTDIVDVSHDVALLFQLCRQSAADAGETVKTAEHGPRRTASIASALTEAGVQSFPAKVTITADVADDFTKPLPKTSDGSLSYILENSGSSYVNEVADSSAEKTALKERFEAAAAKVSLEFALANWDYLKTIYTSNSADLIVNYIGKKLLEQNGRKELTEAEQCFAKAAGDYITKFFYAERDRIDEYVASTKSKGILCIVKKNQVVAQYYGPNQVPGANNIIQLYDDQVMVSGYDVAFRQWVAALSRLNRSAGDTTKAFFSSSMWIEGLAGTKVSLDRTDMPEPQSSQWAESLSQLPELSYDSTVVPSLVHLAGAAGKGSVKLKFHYPTNVGRTEVQQDTLTGTVYPIYRSLIAALHDVSYLAQYSTVPKKLEEKRKTTVLRLKTVPAVEILTDIVNTLYKTGDNLVEASLQFPESPLEEAEKRHPDKASGSDDRNASELMKGLTPRNPSGLILKGPDADLFLKKEAAVMSNLRRSKSAFDLMKGYDTDGKPSTPTYYNAPGYRLILGLPVIAAVNQVQDAGSPYSYAVVDPWFYASDKNFTNGSLPQQLAAPSVVVYSAGDLTTEDGSSTVPWKSVKDISGKPVDALLQCGSGLGNSDSVFMPKAYISVASTTKEVEARSGKLDSVTVDVAKSADATLTYVPAVVWYDKGTKASIVYLNTTTGTYIDFTSRKWFNPELEEQVEYFDLANKSEWCPDTKEWKALEEFIKENNPFDKFDMLRTYGTAVVYKIIPCEDGKLDLWKAAFQIPEAIIKRTVSGMQAPDDPRYVQKWDVLDPRREVALDTADVLRTFIAAEPLTLTSSAKAAGYSESGQRGLAMQTLFGNDAGMVHTTMCNAGESGIVEAPNGGTKYAITAEGYTKVLNDFKAVRLADKSKDDAPDIVPLRVHLGCDLGTGASNEMNWYNNTRIPSGGLSLPWDSYVMYGVQTGAGAAKPLTGFGFFAVAVPVNGEDSDFLDVMLVAHMNPAATILDPNTGVFVGTDGKAFSDSDNPLSKEQMEVLEPLVKLSGECEKKAGEIGTDPGENYFFNTTKYKQLQAKAEKDNQHAKKLLEFADSYLDALHEAFGTDITSGRAKPLRAHRYKLSAATRIGVMGASGSGQMHYHCEYYHLRKVPSANADQAEKDRCAKINAFAAGIYRNGRGLQGLYQYISDVRQQNQRFEMESSAAAQSWPLVSGKRDEIVRKLSENYGLTDFVDGVAGLTTVLSGYGTFKVPDKELVESVVRMIAYQEILKRYSMAQPAPVVLPYYDPYVMDAGMPAAVVYRNDIILTRVSGIQMMVNGPMVNFTVNFTPGISVAKMLPVYLRAMINAGAVKSSLLRRSVFPFHCVEYFNETSFNLNYMAGNYQQMFNRKDFVFDWRDAVVIDLGNNIHKTVNEILPDPAALSHAFNVLSERTPDDKFHIDLSRAKMSDARFPMNEAQMMLKARAWGEDSLYTYTKSCTKYFCQDHRAMMKFSSENSGTYEAEALRNLDTASSKIKTPLDIPRTYYDWHNMFKKLRTSIRSVVNWNDRD